MVSSEQYNTIFLRIPKNASTSLATWFIENCCQPSDTWTMIGDSGKKANNFPEKVLRKYSEQHRKIHLTLNELIDNDVIPLEVAKKRRIVGVVRNPYHRQLSLFFFKSGSPNKSPAQFREEFRNGYHETDGSNHILQSDYFKIGDEMAPNADPWQYEYISQNLEKFISKNNITETNQLQSFKSNRKPKQMIELEKEYYDEKTREAVYQYYKKDFDVFSWEHLN